MWHWPQKQSFQSPNIFNPSSASYFQFEDYPILSLSCSYSSQSTSKPQLWLSLAQLSPGLLWAFPVHSENIKLIKCSYIWSLTLFLITVHINQETHIRQQDHEAKIKIANGVFMNSTFWIIGLFNWNLAYYSI